MKSRLTLKVPNTDDLDFIRWLWNDPETMAAIGGPISLNDTDAAKWFAKTISPGSSSDSYRLILNQDMPVGEISFHRLDIESMTADLNIKIAYAYRGRGYAKEAMYLFLDYFFNEMGGQLIQDFVAKGNIAGKNVLVNFGFVQTSMDDEIYILKLSKKRFNELYQLDNLEHT